MNKMKICLLGEKVSRLRLKELVNFYINEGNKEFPQPENEDSFDKLVEVDNQIVELKFIYKQDKDTNAILFVFDISDSQSIEDIGNLFSESSAENQSIPYIITGIHGELRKDDESMKDLVLYEFYSTLEKKFQTKVFESSIETGQNIDELFYYLIQKVINESKNIFNIGICNTSLHIKGFKKDIRGCDLEIVIPVNVKNKIIKLRIRDEYFNLDSNNQFNINIFRNNTHCFLFLIICYYHENIEKFKKFIRDVQKKFGKNIPIVIIVADWEKRDDLMIKTRITERDINGIEKEFNYKVFKSMEDEEYINDVWKHIGNTCLDIKKHKKKK